MADDLTVPDLDHIAIAFEHLTDGFARYGGELAGEWGHAGPGSGFRWGQFVYRNGMKLELLEPEDIQVNDFLRRFLDRNGPGPHHLTFHVPNLDDTLATVERAGFTPVSINRENKQWQEAFLHPKQSHGIVIQLTWHEPEEDQSDGHEEPFDPPPGPLPQPRTAQPATLVRLVHLVADLDAAAALFAGPLGAHATAPAQLPDGSTFIDLSWTGPGRVRLVQPAPHTAAASWLGDRSGRVDHILFSTLDPQAMTGARANEDGKTWTVPPQHNYGTRLVLVRDSVSS